MFEDICHKRKIVRPHKSISNAQFEVRNVLTNDPYTYVDLWLRRHHEDDALFFWRQSNAFYSGAKNLPAEAQPLLLYYCFLNAAKALLTSKHIVFNVYHGVKSHNMRAPGAKTVLSNEGVKFLNHGVAASISSYFGETEASNIHNLEEMLYNLSHIHRTYCLTYPQRRDVFLPLKDCKFVRDEDTGLAHFEGAVGTDVDWKSFRKSIPTEFSQQLRGLDRIIVSDFKVPISSANKPDEDDMDQLRLLNKAIREKVHYIRGSSTLWYLKTKGPTRIARQPLTLMLGAMHRLSEQCRYHPAQLSSLLNGQRNWLLREFLTMSPSQFIDEVASEITGHQILVPNVRNPV